MKRLTIFTFLLVVAQFVLWSLFVPIFEASDESGYYQGIRWATVGSPLVDMRHLPVALTEIGVLIHGPLYYLVMQPVARILPMPRWTEDQPLTTPFNPERLERFRKGVFNSYTHRILERGWQWNNLEFSVHMLRLVSMGWGFWVVGCVYLVARKAFGSTSLLPLWSAMFVGLNPMVAHIFTGLTVVHLLAALYSVFWYLVFVHYKQPWAAVGMGVTAGLATMTKTTGMLMVPIGLTLIFMLLPRKRWIWQGGLFLLGYVLTAGWYLYRFWKLYGSILPLDVFYSVTFRRGYFFKVRVGMFNFIYDWFVTQFTTFWSGFGYQAVQLPKITLGLLAVFTGLSVWGLTMTWWKRWWLAVLVGWGMYAAGLLQAHLRFPAFHAKDMYPALVPFCLLWVNGLVVWGRKFIAERLRLTRIFLMVLWAGGWYLLVRRDVVFWWKYGGVNLGMIILGYGVVAALWLGWMVLLLRLVPKKKLGKFLQFHSKKLLLTTALVIFLLNSVFLIKVVTPHLFGDRNVSLEEWVRK